VSEQFTRINPIAPEIARGSAIWKTDVPLRADKAALPEVLIGDEKCLHLFWPLAN